MAEESQGGTDDIQLYLRASERLYEPLLRRLDSCGFFPAPLSYRGRIKTKASITKKIEKKRRLGNEYHITDVTDLLGIRFVTMLRLGVSDIAMGIPDVIERLLILLARPGNGELADFGSASLHEINLYLCHPPREISDKGDWLDPVYDELERRLAEYSSAVGIEKPGKIIRQQYSGAHLVVKFPVRVDSHDLLVPVEIQVRSVFEEAWGEIDHRLFYKTDREGLFTAEAPRSTVSDDLGILKAMLDNAERLAASISCKSSALAEFANASVSKPDIRPNLDGVDYTNAIAETVTFRRDLIDEYLALVREKDRIDHLEPSKREYEREYLGLALNFRQLFESGFKQIRIEDVPADQRAKIRALAFLMLMDQAVSLFLDGLYENVRAAIGLYEEITSDSMQPFPGAEGHKYPTAWFRMGEAKNWMIEHAKGEAERASVAIEAYEAFKKARETLSKVPESDHLIIAPDQRAHLDQNIERLQGFAVWRLSDMRRKEPGANPQPVDLENVRLAWKTVERRTKALTPPFTVEELFLHNTATYFAIDGVSLCEKLGQKPWGFPSRRAIRAMLETLDGQMKELGFQDEKFSHTRMAGALLLRETEQATRAAWQVMKAHVKADTSRFSPYQKAMHDRVARDAFEVIERVDRKDSPEAEI